MIVSINGRSQKGLPFFYFFMEKWTKAHIVKPFSPQKAFTNKVQKFQNF